MDRKPTILDMIGSLIPGYAGYAERDGRRNCDKLLRDQVTIVLDEAQASLDARMLGGGAMDGNDPMALENCRKRIDTLADRVRLAPHGASAFFSDSQVREAELLQIYRADQALLDKAGSIRLACLDQPPAAVGLAVAELEAALAARNRKLAELK